MSHFEVCFSLQFPISYILLFTESLNKGFCELVLAFYSYPTSLGNTLNKTDILTSFIIRDRHQSSTSPEKGNSLQRGADREVG